MTNLRQLAAVAMVCGLFTPACADKIDAVQLGGALEIEGPVTYEDHIAPLLARCTGCHGSLGARDGVRVDSYQAARANADRVDEALQSGRMPPTGGLPQMERDLFTRWIVDGLLETRPEPTEETR